MWTYMTCVPGARGAPGRDGQKGERGDKGDSGNSPISSHKNWKECTWKGGIGKDSGLLYVSEEHRFHNWKKKIIGTK